MAKHQILPTEQVGDIIVVTPVGDSLSVEENTLRREIDRLHKQFESPKLGRIVVDIGCAPYFGSLVVGALIALCKTVTDKGGNAAICNASEGMRESLEIMRIDKIIPYYATREDALEAVQH